MAAATAVIMVGYGHRGLVVGEAAAPAIVIRGQEPVGDTEVCLVNCKVLKHMKQVTTANFCSEVVSS